MRELEAFEGPILSELRADGGGIYIEKWCAREGGTTRTLVVRTEPRALAEYLARRVSMLDLLKGPSDGIGFLVDRDRGVEIAVYLVQVMALPERYLPAVDALHDVDLRPAWETR